MEPFIEIKNNIDEMTKHLVTFDKNSHDFFTIKMYLNYIKAELYNVEQLKKTDPEYIKTTLERVNIAFSEYKNRYGISNNDLAQAAQDAAEQMEIEEQEQKKQLPNNPEISSEELKKIDNITEPQQPSTSKENDDFDPYGLGNDNPFEFQQDEFDYMSGGGKKINDNMNHDIKEFNRHIIFLNHFQDIIIDYIGFTEKLIDSDTIDEEDFELIRNLVVMFYEFNISYNKTKNNTLINNKYNILAENTIHLFKIFHSKDKNQVIKQIVNDFFVNYQLRKYTLEQFKKTYTIFYRILNDNDWSEIIG